MNAVYMMPLALAEDATVAVVSQCASSGHLQSSSLRGGFPGNQEEILQIEGMYYKVHAIRLIEERVLSK